jgi:4-cresol dehydrogenase (hydroxylating)
MADRLAAALREWALLLGPAAIIRDGDLIAYTANVTAFHRMVHAALRIRHRDQVPEVVRIAREYDIPLYPISTGRNWGLGSRLPVRDGAVIVDLSGLNKIIGLDRATGTVFIEAGMTQGQLAGYLDREAPELVANMTGSAADTSVVGNTLDRGIGYLAQRSDDLAGLEVVLGTGRTLRTGEWHTRGAEGAHHGPHWRHGIGPSLEGLFIQCNLGIVTAAAVRLRRRPAATVAFRASVPHDEGVVALLDALAGLYRDAVLTLPCRTFDGVWMHGGAEPAWSVFGGIAGRPAVVEALLHEAREALSGLGDLEFATIGGGSAEPAASESSWWRSVLSVMGGRPTDLSVTNWASRIGVRFDAEDLDATDFGMLCDVRAIPFDGAAGHDAAALARKICAGYSLRPCISLSALDAHTLEAVFILLFNRGSDEQKQSAHACADELRSALTAAGLVPHRVGIDAMPEFVSAHDEYWETTASIKRSLDPALIIAPGRYNAL